MKRSFRLSTALDVDDLLLECIPYAVKLANEKYKLVVSEKNKNLLQCLKNDMTFDNVESIKKICKEVLNSHIEDWDNDYSSKIEEELIKFKDEIINAEKVENTNDLILNSSYEDISPIGSLFKTNIETGMLEEVTQIQKGVWINLESVLEEYSDSISTNEKIMILSELIKKML